MPDSQSSSLVPIIDAFVSHWKLANSLLPPLHPLIVLEDLPLATLEAMREELDSGPSGLSGVMDDERVAEEDFADRRRGLTARMRQFNQRVRGLHMGTKWERLLRRVPDVNAGLDLWFRPMESTYNLWQKINERAAVLHVRADSGGMTYSAEMFGAELEQVREAWLVLTARRSDTAVCLAEREILQEQAVEMMKAYGHSLKGRLARHARVVDSLPQLWPGPARGSRRKKRVRAKSKPDSPPAPPPG